MIYDLKEKCEIKDKLKNHDLFLADLDFTIAEPNLMKMAKSIYTFYRKPEIVHNIYPGLKSFLDVIKSEKIIITGNIPYFVRPIAKVLGISKIYYGDHIPDQLRPFFPNSKYGQIIDSIISTCAYKRVIFAGNSPNKDEGILEKIRSKKTDGIIESVLGIWVASEKKINKKFDINILDRDWSELTSLLTN